MSNGHVGYTKGELRKVYGFLSRLLPPGAKPLNAEEVVDVTDLLDRTRSFLAGASAQYERGAKVLEWRVPNLQAPTMNRYAYLKGWMKGEIGKKLDEALRKIVERTTGALVHGTSRKRWVRVTRFTTRPDSVDDPNAIDAMGGKMPIDALVRCGVLNGDTPAFCHREGMVRTTELGNTHVLVEVFETAHDEVPDSGPRDARVEQPPARKKGKKREPKGPMAKAIAEAVVPR